MSGRRSCFLASRHSPGVTAPPGGGHEPAKSPVFFTVGATPPGSASKAYLPSPGRIPAPRRKDGGLIPSSAQAPRPAGHEGRAAPPHGDLVERPLGPRGAGGGSWQNRPGAQGSALITRDQSSLSAMSAERQPRQAPRAALSPRWLESQGGESATFPETISGRAGGSLLHSPRGRAGSPAVSCTHALGFPALSSPMCRGHLDMCAHTVKTVALSSPKQRRSCSQSLFLLRTHSG